MMRPVILALALAASPVLAAPAKMPKTVGPATAKAGAKAADPTGPKAGAKATAPTPSAAAEHGNRMTKMAESLGMDAPPDAAASTEVVERLVARTLATHPALAAERARLDARAAGVDAARGAYQPQAALTASAGRGRAREPGESDGVATETRKLGATVRENLWRGGQDALNVDIAERDRLVAELTRDAKAAELAFQVRRAALQYNTASLQQLLSEEAAKDAAELVALSERKFGAGQVGRIDVHTATMRATEARAQAVKAAVATRDAWFGLLRALGAAEEPDAALAADLQDLTKASLPFPPQPPALDAAPATTLSERTAAATAERSALALETSRRARWLPEVDLTAGASREKTATRTDAGVSPTGDAASADDRAVKYNVGLELTWPLWARVKDQQIAVAAAERQAAEAKAADAKNAAKLETLALKARLADLYAALGPYRDAWHEASRLYDAQRQLYDAGAVDVLVVTDADSQRLKALRDWYDSVYEIKLALLRWQALSQGYVAP